jgi:hypothetical protein
VIRRRYRTRGFAVSRYTRRRPRAHAREQAADLGDYSGRHADEPSS